MAERQVRTRRKAAQKPVVDKDALKNAMERWDVQRKRVLLHQTTMKEIETEITDLMKAGELEHFEIATVTADFKETAGRNSTVIDVKGYAKLVTEKEFYDSVSVGVTKAREYLSEKELATVSKTVHGATKAASLSIKPKKV